MFSLTLTRYDEHGIQTFVGIFDTFEMAYKQAQIQELALQQERADMDRPIDFSPHEENWYESWECDVDIDKQEYSMQYWTTDGDDYYMSIDKVVINFFTQTI